MYTEGSCQMLIALSHWGSLCVLFLGFPWSPADWLSDHSLPFQAWGEDEMLTHESAVEAMWPAWWCRNLSQGVGLSSKSLTLVTTTTPAGSRQRIPQLTIPIGEGFRGEAQAPSPAPTSSVVEILRHLSLNVNSVHCVITTWSILYKLSLHNSETVLLPLF